MTLRVLFFSVLRDIIGASELVVELPTGHLVVADLLQHLFERWPRLREWDRSLLVAVDHVYARRDTPLSADAEVAIMPPVQGG